jgi:YHS domain-containing protein
LKITERGFSRIFENHGTRIFADLSGHWTRTFIMKRLSLVLFAVLASFPAAAAAQPPQIAEALDGVDTVVLLQQGKEVFGKSVLSVERGRFRYLFSTPDTKATFEREPAKYEIQLGGMCARMGPPTGANPSDYFVHEGKIYIFGSDECRKRFIASPEKFIPKPAPAMPSGAAAAAGGREILEKAVAAMGGAAAIDKVTSYAETASQVQRRGEADVTINIRTILRFPGEARLERTMPSMQGAARTIATVLTPSAQWTDVQGNVYPMPADARPAIEKNFWRHPLALMRIRKAAGFKSAALAPATVDGTAVERVRVRYGAMDVTLATDAKSGRVHSLELVDRNRDGEIGTYTLVYSDFRDVGGVMVPHSTHALFDGQPDASQTLAVKSAEVNPKIDPQLFTKPTGATR